MTDDEHLPRGDDWCEACQSPSHFACFDTELDLADAGPHIAMHDAAHAVTGEHP